MTNADGLAEAQAYLKAYSLSCEPFANTLDGRFFYAGSALMQRLDLLSHLTQFGDAITLVSGPPGSGKTTMLGRFVGQASRQWRLCLLDAGEFGQFRQRLSDALGIGDGGDERRIIERWASQSEAMQLLVIVIDNAQELPEHAFEFLCTLLEQPVAERIRLILFGTPEAQHGLKQSLDRRQLPITTQLLEIPRLSEEDTASYLMYRLAVAGYSGESPFPATEIRAICKAAQGRPAATNRLAHDALVEHQMRGRHSTQPRPAAKPPGRLGATWALASVLVLGVAAYVAWERLRPAPPVETVADNLDAPGPVRNVPLALPEPQARSAAALSRQDAGAIPDIPRQPRTASTAGPSPSREESVAAAEPQAQLPGARLPRVPAPEDGNSSDADTAPVYPGHVESRIDVATPEQIRPDAPVPLTHEPEPVSAAPAVARSGTPPPAAESLVPPMAAKPEATASAAKAPPETPGAVATETTAPAVARSDAPPPAAEPVAPPVAAKPEAAASAVKAPPQIPGAGATKATPPSAGELQREAIEAPHRETWLLQQSGNQYSLQLLGTRDEKSIPGYIKDNGLDAEHCAYFRGDYKGDPWYVLLYGVYPDRDAAVKARAALPARIRKSEPWPRSLASVHSAISETR